MQWGEPQPAGAAEWPSRLAPHCAVVGGATCLLRGNLLAEGRPEAQAGLLGHPSEQRTCRNHIYIISRFGGWGQPALSHCLENKRSPRKVAKDLVAINSSETSAVSMVMNDLIVELKKTELVGDLVCSSFLHDVIDKGVSLHEWMDGIKAL